MIARIRQALLDHKVVFLRDQSLNYRRQVAFAERLGPLTLGHPTLASPTWPAAAGGDRMWMTCAQRRRACVYTVEMLGIPLPDRNQNRAFTWESANHNLCIQKKL